MRQCLAAGEIHSKNGYFLSTLPKNLVLSLTRQCFDLKSVSFPCEIHLQLDIIAALEQPSTVEPRCRDVIPSDFVQMAFDKFFNYHSGLLLPMSYIF